LLQRTIYLDEWVADCNRHFVFRALPFFFLAVLSAPALAQRTGENAVTSADDAFGKSVGDEKIGIYSAEDVRGFSPYEAGNIRLEGLYFTLQGRLSDRLVSGSAIKVGLTAQGYPFPAPTGIADFTLRRPGKDLGGSTALTVDSEHGYNLDFDLRVPLDGDKLGFTFGALYGLEAKHFGSTNRRVGIVASGRYAPSDSFSLTPFLQIGRPKGEETEPLIFLAAGEVSTPNRYTRSKNLTQPWSGNRRQSLNFGIINKAKLAGFDIDLGLFHSEFNNAVRWSDLLIGVKADGSAANRRFVRQEDDLLSANSGELKLSRALDDGPRRHMLYATLRGKQQRRQYGGNFTIDVGASRIDAPDVKAEPVPVHGPKSRDNITQTSLGIGYGLRWRSLGEINLGLLKTRYRKSTKSPLLGINVPDTKANPLLPSVTAAFYLTPKFALYGGYVKGLEDSAPAPANASNLNEAPPAIRTEQKDAGIRWKVADKITLVAGVFDIRKPYFNLDASSRFRQLGSVRNRGIEASLAGQIATGLNLVAGSVFIDSRVSGEAVNSGAIGNHPVGEPKQRSIISLSYAIPSVEGLSVESGFEALGKRWVNSANTQTVGGRTTFSIGARYRFALAGAKWLARLQLSNLTNHYDYNVATNGALTTLAPRKASFTLAADF
jgi:iron complex outermembrane recepter protein